MKLAVIIALSGLVALTACSGSEPEATTSEAAATAIAVPVATPAAATERPTATASSSPEYPAAMLGRWGMVKADCTSSRGDNKGMLTVTPHEIRFYESVARLAVVKETSPLRLRATLAYEGEGMKWTRDAELEAMPDSDQLVLQEFGDDAVPGPRTYTRCK